MYENKFDKAIDDTVGVEWDDRAKVRLFARFLQQEAKHLYQAWEKFLDREADEEMSMG